MDLTTLPPSTAVISVLLGIILVLGGIIAKLESDNARRADEQLRETNLRLADMVKVLATNTDIAATQHLMHEQMQRQGEHISDIRDMLLEDKAERNARAIVRRVTPRKARTS